LRSFGKGANKTPPECVAAGLQVEGDLAGRATGVKRSLPFAGDVGAQQQAGQEPHQT